MHGEPRIAEGIRQLGPIRPAIGSLFEVQGEEVLYIPDLLGSDAYRADPNDRKRIEAGASGPGSLLRSESRMLCLGATIAYRKEVRLFTEKQIAYWRISRRRR